MLVRTAGRCAAVLAILAGAIVTAPTAVAQPQPGSAAAAQPGSAGAAAAGRYLATPRPDPLPPPGARQYATQLRAAAPVTDGVPERIAGADRYATAAAVAQQFGTADAVIVANGTNAKSGFDALSANYLAGQLGAPIVLTAGGATLEPETAAAVQAVLAGSASPRIYVMGADDSVSQAAADALGAIAASVAGTAGDYVHRVAGDSRYATSALAAAAGETGPGAIGFGARAALPTAILASGAANADALAAGPLSNAWGVPVLLTAAAALPPEIAAVIKDFGIKQLIVLGGTDRVSDAVVAQAQAAGAGRIQRIAGANRFATAAQLYTLARTTFVGPGGTHYSSGVRAFLANGVTGFPDALAVGPLAAKLGSPLLTVAAESLADTTLGYLNSAKTSLAAITVLGAAATVGITPLIVAKASIGVNILAGSDGVVPPENNVDAKFEAAAAQLPTFAARLQLARTYLPGKGAAIGQLHPYMLEGWNAAGLTEFVTCDVWMDDSLPDDQLLDILRHEYVHALQCRAENKGYRPGYVTTSDEAVNGVERGADAGAYLLGNNYLYYVQYGPTAGPLRTSEIVLAQRLFAFYRIAYRVG